MSAPTERDSPRDLPDLVDSASASGPREPLDSVTEVNGTVARFEMAYSPPIGERITFGPPMRQRIASFVFLAFALVVVGLVIAAHLGSSNTSLYIWIVEGDRGRALPASALASMVLISALGTVLRARMRGVVVHADGIEARYLLIMGMPRIKRWAWAQVERMVMDDDQVMLDLWDNTYERLPDVAEPPKLQALLERLAAAHKIRLTRLPKIGAAGSESS